MVELFSCLPCHLTFSLQLAWLLSISNSCVSSHLLGLHVTLRRSYGLSVQKCFSPPRTQLDFQSNSAKKKCILLITNMRPLSRGFEAKYEESNRLIDLFSLYVLFSQFRPRDCQLYARGCTSIGHLKETVLQGTITWSEMGKQNIQAKKVYFDMSHLSLRTKYEF